MTALLSPSVVASGGGRLGEEHAALRDTIRRLAKDRFPEEEIRRLIDLPSGYDPDNWRLMAKSLGLQGLAIPEEYGGAGYGWTEQALVFHEFGRALIAGPYLATVALAVPTILATGDTDLQEEYLPRIAAGELTATVVHATRADVTDLRITETAGGDSFVLSGQARTVLDGADSELVLVLTELGDRTVVCAIDRGAPGVEATPLATLDLGRRHARLRFDDTPVQPITLGPDTDPALAHARDLYDLALAAELSGICARVMEMSVEYAKTRFQFNRPIGSFQAVKHTCSDMFLTAQSATALVEHAAWLADSGSENFTSASAAAQAYSLAGAEKSTYDNVHIHGGMGFTWEHCSHLFFRRTRADAALLGGQHRALANLADRIGL